MLWRVGRNVSSNVKPQSLIGVVVNRAIDPDVNASGINLAAKMIPRYLHSMIRVPNIEKLFETTLVCLEAPDLMPKRAAADFWVSCLSTNWGNLANDVPRQPSFKNTNS